MSDYAERVAKGIALLDDEAPGWRELVNRMTLNISSSFNCVLGQVFSKGDPWESGYEVGCKRLGIASCSCGCEPDDWHLAADFGFAMRGDENFSVNDFLTDEWIRQANLA